MKDSSLKVCRNGFLCPLAGRRFRSTLARLAEWCNALGKEKGKGIALTDVTLLTEKE